MVPYLIATEGPNAGSTYVLGGRTLVGRGEDSDIQLLEGEISRRHALILKGLDGTFRIGDLSSTNGTFVGGDRITECSMAVGDSISLGTSTFLFLRAKSLSDVLNGLSVDDLKLVSGPANSSTRELPANLALHLRKQRNARRRAISGRPEADVPTTPLENELSWLAGKGSGLLEGQHAAATTVVGIQRASNA